MNIFDPLISGSLSVSGSGEISGDLTVLGVINATISGTTSNAISASHAAEYLLTSSFETFTGSHTTGSFTGSFSGVLVGDGSGISGIPASGVTGLNLSQITDGSATASISDADGFRINKNVEITGSLIVEGPITATEFFTQIVSSSIIYESGSTKFGDTQDDSHDFTGSVNITGSLKVDDIDIGGDKFVTISVSDLNGKYFIDNVQNPVLTFIKGFTYKFLYPNILSHPLRFSTTSDGTHGGGTIYSDGVTTGSTPNYIQIEVTDTTPTTLYYFCTVHTNMGNSINVLSDILNVEADRGLVYIEPSRTATTGSNKFIGDQDFTGSVNITGSISLNGEPIGTGKLDEVDFNSYTSSTDDRLDDLEIESGSVRTDFNSYTSSNDNRLTSLESESGSIRDDFNGITGSYGDRLDLIEISTGSLNQFTSSINTTIKDKLNIENVVSGAIQINIAGTSGYTTFSSSIALTTNNIEGRVGDLETESGSVRTDFNSYTSSNDDRIDLIDISTGSLNQFTSSINTTIKNKLNDDDVISGSIQIDITGTSGYTTFSSSISSTINQVSSSLSSSVAGHNLIQDGRLNSLEGGTGSYATTGSNIFQSDQTITGSLFISENLIVAGSSSISFISQSTLDIGTNLITVNAQNPGTRFGGLAVIDSGSSPTVSGSLLFDSINDQWIFVHQNQGTITSSVVLMGPESFNNLGSEIYPTTNRIVKSINSEHLGDSNITDNGIKVSINSNTEITGTLVVTNNISSPNISDIQIATGSLNQFSSSLLAAVELTGSNLTVKGDLLVKGTTTNVNTTTLDVDNNLINLNGTGATFAGLRVKDTTLPNQVSGSLLWDATNDYWIAGQLGSEQRIVRETEFTNAVTRVGNLETESGSIRAAFNSYTSSNNTTNTTQNSRLTSLESATGSYTTTDYFVTGATWGSSTGVITLTRNDGNTVTVDIDGRYLESYTETDTLATVTSRGATTTDKITITAAGVGNSPLLRINPTNAISFVHGLEIMASGLTSTQAVILPIGVSGGTKNAAYIGYRYSGTAGSNDNVLSFGHWGADHLMTMNGQGNVAITGTISASNLSGTNTGDQTLSGLGGQPQLNGTGFVKANGTTITYDNSTYLTSYTETDTLSSVVTRGNSTTSEIIVGALTVQGSLSRGTWIAGSNYVTGADNIVLKGNSSGVSGIFFESEKDGTNINHPSDFGFIQFHSYGIGGSTGEANRLVIGVSNDADDMIVLNPVDTNGVKVRVGTGTTEYTVWHSGNLTNLNQLSNGPGYITGNQTITLSGDASGSGTTSISVTVDRIDGVGFRNTGVGGGVNAQTLDSNGMTYVTDVDNAGTNLTGNATDGALYSQIYSSSWQHQIYGDYRTGIMYVRGKNNNTWQSWKRVALSNATSFTNVSSVTFNHTLGTANLTAQVFDTNGDMFFPSNIRITSTQVIVTFSTNRSGRLVVTG